MNTVISAACVYLFLLLVFRIAGRRTMADLTTFDFVVVLIISETTQNVLSGSDGSLTGAFIAILTLVGLDVLLAMIKGRLLAVALVLDGTPTVIVHEGRPLERAMKKARVDLDDVLMAARESQGLARLDQVRYAILETNGRISIVPRSISPAKTS